MAVWGDLATLEAAAVSEGALNVIVLPQGWANHGAVLDLFVGMAKVQNNGTVGNYQTGIDFFSKLQAAGNFDCHCHGIF